VINPTDEPVELKLVTYFDEAMNNQFGMKVWLPERSRRYVVQPLHMPRFDKTRQYEMAGLTTVLLDESGFTTRELSLEKSVVSYKHNQHVVVVLTDQDERMLASMVSHFEKDLHADDKAGAYVEERDRQYLLRTMSSLRAPSFPAGWDGVNTVIISTQRSLLDSAQMEALRQWLFSGGRLWMMIDHVSPEYCTQLLGEDFHCEVVNTARLSSVKIQGLKADSRERHFTNPVKMVRLLTSGYETVHRVGAWPVTATRRLGLGTVVLTTLEIRAWIDHNSRPDAAMKHLLEEAFVERGNSLSSAMRINPMEPQQTVTVTDTRNRALWILIATIGMMLATTYLAVKRGRLEYSPLIGYATASVATLALATVGYATRRAIRPSVSSVQVVRIDEQGRFGKVDGVISYTDSMTRDLTITSRAGGVSWPAEIKGNRQQRSMIWSDLNTWQWDISKVPPRMVQRAHVSQIVRLKQPVTAHLMYTATGMTGQLIGGQFGKLTDPILLSQYGDLKVKQYKDQHLTIKFNVDAPWSTGTSLLHSKYQKQKRKSMIRNELAGRMKRDSPIMMAWSDPVDLGLQMDVDAERTDLMLLTIPVKFIRPPAGSAVTIVPEMIVCDPKPGVTGWPIMLDQPDGAIALRLQLPAHLMPLKLESARLCINTLMPSSSVSLLDPARPNRPVLMKANSQGKQFELDITPIATSILAEDGTLSLAISSQDTSNASKMNITNVRLFVKALIMADES
jgi:hypothetical protein